MRRAVKDLAFGLLVTTAILATVEGLLWVLRLPRPSAEQVGLSRKDTFGHLAGPMGPWMEPDPDLLWRFKPNNDVEEWLPDKSLHWSYHVNADGFRGPEIPATPGRPLVLCAGDSVTAGYGVDDAHTYPALLQAELRKLPGWETALAIDTGVNGYTSEQGRVQTALTIPRLEPDVVIFEYGINDDWLTIFPDAMLLAPSRVRTIQRLLGRSRIYRLLRIPIVRAKIARAGESIENKVAHVSPDRYVENLRTILALARREGSVPILVAPTSQFEAGSRRWPPADNEKRILSSPLSDYRDRMAQVARDEFVPYLDLPLLSGRLPESRARFVDWCHPDAAGLALLAQSLAPMVEAASGSPRGTQARRSPHP